MIRKLLLGGIFVFASLASTFVGAASPDVTCFGGDDQLGVPTSVSYDRKGALVARHTGSVSSDMLEQFIDKWDQPRGAK